MQDNIFRAKIENLNKINLYLKKILDGYSFNTKKQLQIHLAVEELFANVIDHADDNKEDVEIKTGQDEEGYFFISLINTDAPFNPWEQKKPNIKLSFDDGTIKGLGIYIAKLSVDKYDYEYRDGKNIVTIYKKQ